jgi:hypothetical protein
MHFCAEGPRQTPRQRHPWNYLSSLDRLAHHSQPGSYDSQELSSLSSFSPGAAVVCFSGSLAGAGNYESCFRSLTLGPSRIAVSRAEIFAKKRDIQSKRLLSEANLLAKLQESEARIWRTTLLKISRAGRQQARPRVCLCGRGRVKEEKRSLRRLTALVVTSHGKIAHAPAGMI